MEKGLSFSETVSRAFRLLCLILLCGWASQLGAQDIDMSNLVPCPNPSESLTEAPTNLLMSPITINVVNSDGPATMSIQTVEFVTAGVPFPTPVCGTPCTSPVNTRGIQINAAGSSVTIEGTPTDAGTLNVTLQATDNSKSCAKTFSLPFVRQPVDLLVILDRSGSMGWAYDGSTSPPDDQRRWDGLVTGVGVMAAQLDLLNLPGSDSLGMRMFASSVIVPGAPFNAGLVGLEDHIGSLVGALPDNPSGSTALGDGILAGRDLLLAVNPGHRKAMIVFSDGVQNTGDQVRTVAPNAFTQTESGQELNGVNPSDTTIDIFTISLGSSGHNPSLMESIANANGGKYLNTLTIPSPQSEDDFETLFNTQVINTLVGSSPQYVDIRQDAFPVIISDPEITTRGGGAPATEQSFSVNKGASSVIVTLLAPTRFEPHFISIMKDGRELIQFAQRIQGSGFVSIGLDYRRLDTATLGGEWTVRARLGTRPEVEVPYTMMILVDDHIIDPRYNLGAESFKVGQAFNPSVTLRRVGQPIENAQVQAIVAKPGDDINDLVARATVDFDVPGVDRGSPDVAKLAVLLKDTAFINKIEAEDQQLNLAYNASSEAYEGGFNGLDVAGVYQVIYRVTADDPELGKIRRYHRESFYVRFPDIDLDNSQLSVSVNDQGNSVIHFLPQASNGKLIGSGWGGAIGLQANNAKILEVTDHADGSYDVVVEGVLTGPGKISVSGETVYEGDLGQLQDCYRPDANIIQRIQCWLISLGLPGWLIWIIMLVVVAVAGLFFRKKKKTP